MNMLNENKFSNYEQKFLDHNWTTANQSYFNSGEVYPLVPGTQIRQCPSKLDIGAEHGTTISFGLNPELYTGNIAIDINSPYLAQFQTGVAVALDEAGYIVLADGADAKLSSLRGFVRVPATQDQLFQNLPTLGSGLISVHIGGAMFRSFLQVVETDLVPGEVLYHGTGANKGLLTRTKSASGVAVAVVVAGNTAQSPGVNILVY